MFDIKNTLLAKLSALRVVSSNGFPSLRQLTNKLQDNKNNSFTFLLDLMRTLLGWESIKTELVNLLTYHLVPLEHAIKVFLKKLIRTHFLCNTDNVIPQHLIDTGFNVQIAGIDFFSMLKIDPDTETGGLLYAGQNDMNTFLYEVINGGDTNWKDILVISYLTSGIVDGQQRNDVLNIKIHPSYTGETINRLLNDFVDSVAIYSLPLVINRLLDNLFGTISLKIGKSPSKLKEEEEMNALIEKIIDLPDEIIDNSYYSFTNAELKDINKKAAERSTGYRTVINCGGAISTLPIEEITDTNTGLNGTSELIEIKTLLDNKFQTMGNNAVNNIKDSDRGLGLLDFYYEMLKGTITALVNSVLSPKVILFFTIYFKIANQTVGFVDFKSFLLQNKNFVNDLIRNVIMPVIIDFLMKLVMKEIRRLVRADNLNKKAEQTRYYSLALTSLFGISDVTNNIIDRLR